MIPGFETPRQTRVRLAPDSPLPSEYETDVLPTAATWMSSRIRQHRAVVWSPAGSGEHSVSSDNSWTLRPTPQFPHRRNPYPVSVTRTGERSSTYGLALSPCLNREATVRHGHEVLEELDKISAGGRGKHVTPNQKSVLQPGHDWPTGRAIHCLQDALSHRASLGLRRQAIYDQQLAKRKNKDK